MRHLNLTNDEISSEKVEERLRIFNDRETLVQTLQIIPNMSIKVAASNMQSSVSFDEENAFDDVTFRRNFDCISEICFCLKEKYCEKAANGL